MPHPHGRLTNKVAILTGGATGIGEAIGHKLAYEGAREIVAGQPDDPADDVVVAAIREHGGTAVEFAGDRAGESQARRARETRHP